MHTQLSNDHKFGISQFFELDRAVWKRARTHTHKTIWIPKRETAWKQASESKLPLKGLLSMRLPDFPIKRPSLSLSLSRCCGNSDWNPRARLMSIHINSRDRLPCDNRSTGKYFKLQYKAKGNWWLCEYSYGTRFTKKIKIITHALLYASRCNHLRKLQLKIYDI